MKILPFNYNQKQFQINKKQVMKFKKKNARRKRTYNPNVNLTKKLEGIKRREVRIQKH